MNTYTLYLDESETNKQQSIHAYAIGGVIIEDTIHDTILVPKIEQLKKLFGQIYQTVQKLFYTKKKLKMPPNIE